MSDFSKGRPFNDQVALDAWVAEQAAAGNATTDVVPASLPNDSGEPVDPTARPVPRKDEFIAVLAHELRNPIAPIRSGLDLLATEALDAPTRRATMAMMKRQLTHLVRLVDDLLDTVRLSTGQLKARRELVPLSEVLDAAVESIRPVMEAKHQLLRLKGAYLDIVVDADAVRLSQAFVNILSANVRATPHGGAVTLQVASDEAQVTITFADEGEGLFGDDIANVFDLFPTTATQKSDEGLGIGLALVRGLVELNLGTVEARNQEAGGGSLFTVTLPIAGTPAGRASAGEPTKTIPTEVRDSLKSHRVLVVDDNQDAAETLGLLFELDGHTIRLAHDGPSAVASTVEFQPEIILMDIGLPVFSGLEAARRIRQDPTLVRPRIIALTGWGSEADRAASSEAGCDLHLVKPISHEELREAIRSMIPELPERPDIEPPNA
ncbi:MAG: luxQ 3 [Rhizobacter sp.]|nr:luxQ 3 [Rhizobacter sp.]